MNHPISEQEMEQMKQTPEYQEAVRRMSNDTFSFSLITPQGEKIEMQGLTAISDSNESK